MTASHTIYGNSNFFMKHGPVRPGSTKHRSYSTSNVQERVQRNPTRAKRSPLTPLRGVLSPMCETYDVISCPKLVSQGTYTKPSRCRVEKNKETPHFDRKQTRESQSVKTIDHDHQITMKRENCSVKNIKDTKLTATGSTWQTELLKVVFGGSSIMLKNVSPESSLKDCVEAMKLTLEEGLGQHVFSALHKYLLLDVDRELDAGLDIYETLFQILGEDGIVFVPLMLQYMQWQQMFGLKHAIDIN